MAKDIYYYQDNSTKNKSLSVLEVLLIILCFLIILTVATFNILFHKADAMPKVFGTNVYVNRATNMQPAIPANSVVFANPQKTDNLAPGSVILCTVANDTSKLNTILRIQQIAEDSSGQPLYILKGDTNSSNETIGINKSQIVGLCESYSSTLGKIIVFTTSQIGLIVCIIVPCILFIIIQVVHIIKYKNYDVDDDDEYEDDDDFDENDKVLFSTRNSDNPQINKHHEEPALKHVYVEEKGKANYLDSPIPNSNSEELHQKLYSENSPLRRPTVASRQTEEARKTVSSNFKYKNGAFDTSFRNASETSDEMHFDTSKSNFTANDDIDNDPPKLYYQKTPSKKVILEPPKVENPVDVTIPTEAIMPKETIAPPPKKTNNKTVEELMQMIDNAQKK